jgi:tRNA (cmo5U34)-methyltransferase
MTEQPNGTSIGHLPGADRWEFDRSVTSVFDDMLRRSIPQYETMRDAVDYLSGVYVQRGTTVLDLGCSRGDALDPLVRRYGAHNRFVGVDVSEPMLEAARERFAGYISTGIVEIQNVDLREQYPPVQASVTLAILTLQFTPIEYRHRIVRSIYEHTLPGGALILVEKILGETAPTQELFVDRYHAMKRANGYSHEEVEAKRRSLEGVLVPLTASGNEELLRGAGFRVVECFWRWMNFAGWLAVKSS